VIIRDARREDVPQIVALLADDMLGAAREAPAAREGDLDDAYWTAFEQVQADPCNRLIVAEIDGLIAATLQLTLIPGLSRHGMLRAQIEAVRVAASQRGHGLGQAMIRWAIQEARDAGCGMVQLTSDKRRPDAIRFYESLGFTPTHEGLKLAL
jgi:GNAT superfamily N-acetyltransferase